MNRTPSPAELLLQLEDYNSHVDPQSMDAVARRAIATAAEQVANAHEDPAVAVMRRTVGQFAEAAVVKVALDIDLLPALAEGGEAKPLSELATRTDTEERLLARVLRFLVASGIANENGGNYLLASTCAMFGDEKFAKAANACVKLIKPMFDEVPAVIRDNGRRDPRDRLNGAAQRAFRAPGRDLFGILKDQGTVALEGFSTFLNTFAKDSAKIYDAYPVQEALVDAYDRSVSEYVWIDVGGSFGAYTADLQRRYPALQDKCVIEDMAPVIELARSKGMDKHVEFISHDLLEQPIKDSRVYCIRQCFHNWQDENCRVILQRLAETMKPGYSRVLIHDIVMPETGASNWELTMDWMMMSGYSNLERTEAQFKGIVDSAGLKINKIYSDETSLESYMEVIKH